MNKLTNIKLNTKSFSDYTKAMSGVILATTGETLTDTEIRLIWLIKTGCKLSNNAYVTRKLRAQLAHSMELKPQTLYNRLSDLRRKKVLIRSPHGLRLSPLFNDRINLTITYNYNEDQKLQDITSGTEE